LSIDAAIKIFYFSDPNDGFGVFEILGIAVWVIGYAIENVGDH